MTCAGKPNGGDDQLQSFADQIYASLAARFPVCLSSDEFHFYPQFRPPQPDWTRWDDFSGDAIDDFQQQAAGWVSALDRYRTDEPSSLLNGDVDLLQQVLRTVQEQLSLAEPHRAQPTFHLSIISIGLAEALETSEGALDDRLRSLPDFIHTARAGLRVVPVLFRDLGVDMTGRIMAWIRTLPTGAGVLEPAIAALDEFRRFLQTVAVSTDFRLPLDLYARIADRHLGCRMAVEEIAWHLDREIDETGRLLDEEAARISPGKSWLQVFHDQPPPVTAGNDAAGIYREIILKLQDHCLAHDFVPAAGVAGCDVEIKTIPDHLRLVRANAAYSMPPGHPPKGGVFYILPPGQQMPPRDMTLLAAHETFPGHHLLDTLRWRLEQPLRRCLEFPLFYEGWACIGEEILFDTAFFSGPQERLFMAKRRFWRAHRGRADLMLHTGRWGLDEAAAALAGVGLVDRQQARAMVCRYALKPGYQLVYTIGRRKFRELYTDFLGRDRTPAQFVRQALSQGEIGFERLSEIMFSGGAKR